MVVGGGAPGEEVVVVGVVVRGIRVELALASWVSDMGSKMELKAVAECTWGMACWIERGRWRAKNEEAATSNVFMSISTLPFIAYFNLFLSDLASQEPTQLLKVKNRTSRDNIPEGCRCSVFGTAGNFPPAPSFPHDSPSTPLENPVLLFAGEDDCTARLPPRLAGPLEDEYMRALHALGAAAKIRRASIVVFDAL